MSPVNKLQAAANSSTVTPDGEDDFPCPHVATSWERLSLPARRLGAQRILQMSPCDVSPPMRERGGSILNPQPSTLNPQPHTRTPRSALRTQLAFVALGSNLGDSAAIIRRAIERLQDLSDQPLRRSSLWQTTPVDCPPGCPLFINAVVGLVPRSGETPESLLEKLQALEKQFGRRPKQARNAPRLLDLDLIAFGAQVRATPRLTLPHPRAHQRRFVLAPLAELAPALILPGQSRPVRQLLKNLRTPEQVSRLD